MSRAIELLLGFASAALLVATVAAIPWLLRRLPKDYLVRRPPKRAWPKRLAINLGALAVIALGVAMLVLPGPGVITVLIGLALLDLPIRRRAIAWLLHRRKIRETVQTLRARGGQDPLEIPA